MEHGHPVCFQPFATLTQNGIIDVEAVLLTFIDKRQRPFFEVIRLPAAEPQTHPVPQMEPRGIAGDPPVQHLPETRRLQAKENRHR